MTMTNLEHTGSLHSHDLTVSKTVTLARAVRMWSFNSVRLLVTLRGQQLADSRSRRAMPMSFVFHVVAV
jgi:hypothetical protein